MADIDIDSFGEHDRTESRTDETGENIPLIPAGGQLGNQTEESKKLHLEEKAIELNLCKIMLEIYIESYLKVGVKPKKHFTMIISNSKRGTILQRQEKALNDQRCAEIGWNVSRYIG